MLVDHTDAELCSMTGRSDLHLFAAYVYLAIVGLIHSEQHTHKSGFSRAVLAEKREYLPLLYTQRNIVVGNKTGKTLGDMLHFNDIFIIIHLRSR